MKTPYYIKNFVLLCVLSFMLLVIYAVYFRKDGIQLSGITRILKGLNSETFNYLETNSEPLRLARLLNNYQAAITSNQFMDECVRINKPCKFEGLAKFWPAVTSWKHSENGYAYLKQLLDDRQVEVFVSMEDAAGIVDSFKNTTRTKMRYSQFLEKASYVGVTLRDSSDHIKEALVKEIVEPPFIADFNDFSSLELI